jgi:corrinoid protein of di/trimethylamine methyltransferase
MSHDLLTRLVAAVVDGNQDETDALTREALVQGLEPLAVIDDALVPALRDVGEKFRTGEYFLPNLIVSARAVKRAMQTLEPELRSRQQWAAPLATVVIGTVRGDIHEIGKSLVGIMLSANGFDVHDLGVDVPVERFLAAVREHRAGLLGLSALLTTTMSAQRSVIEALGAEGMRDSVKVMVGGAPVTASWAAKIGADGYAEDAIAAVALARRLVGLEPLAHENSQDLPKS